MDTSTHLTKTYLCDEVGAVTGNTCVIKDAKVTFQKMDLGTHIT